MTPFDENQEEYRVREPLKVNAVLIGPTANPRTDSGLDPIDVCNALSKWAEVANVESPRAGTGGLAIWKSCLLNRLIYGGELGPSMTPCPVHKGKWSGIQSGWPGQEWHHVDGSRTPVDVEPRLQEHFDAGCRCFMHRGASDTTGWNPDKNCGCSDD